MRRGIGSVRFKCSNSNSNSNSNRKSDRIIIFFRYFNNINSSSNVRYKPIINEYSYNQSRSIVSSRIISLSSSKGDSYNNDPIISNNKSNIPNPNTNPTPKINPSVANNIGTTAKNYTFELNKVYMEAEKNLMIRINETNSRRFRLIFFSSLFGITVIVVIFGKKIRKALAQETAGFAKETLENESLKIQTQELAMAVVQTVLNDKDITAHAATFLQDAATVPATQEALLKLVLHILQHPDSLRELSKLCSKVVANLSVDNDTIKNFAQLFTSVFQDEKLKSALLQLLLELSKDEELVKAICTFTVTLINRPEISEVIKKLLMTSTQTVLQDQEIINKSKEFVTDVMGDDTIQREGGDALLNTVKHALKPGIIRIAGVALVAVSVAFAKILLSPY